jgi:hypothetical protein
VNTVHRTRPRGAWLVIGTILSTLAMAPLIGLFLAFMVVVAPVVLWSAIRSRRRTTALRQEWERRHGSHGRRVLFVYSHSPHWKHYIETVLLPELGAGVLAMNWSSRVDLERADALEWRVFQRWRPATGYNPLAIVIPRRGPVRHVSFWQAFRDRKHGKVDSLRAREAELRALMQRL